MASHSDDDEQVQQEEQEEGQELLQGHEEQDATMEDGQDKDVGPLVDTIQRGMDAMSSKQDELYDQIDALTENGAKFLDDLKQAFLHQMQRFREGIAQSCTQQEAEWRELSDTTTQYQQRLSHAQHFVRQLGMSVGGLDQEQG